MSRLYPWSKYKRAALPTPDRIRAGIYNAGCDAACGHYLTRPKPPYRRADFRALWQQGFDDAERDINEALAALGKNAATPDIEDKSP